jgi:lysozyme family protein
MADFQIAYKRTLGFEGEETNDGEDPGGRTRYGIAENYWPQYWQGDGPTIETANLFYRNEFWQKMKGDDIDDQLVANEIFDTAVNCGGSTWHFCQEAYNCLTEQLRLIGSGYYELEVDGRIGPKTVAAINSFTKTIAWRDALLGALDHLQGRRYWDGKAKYRKGWFANRIGGHHKA